MSPPTTDARTTKLKGILDRLSAVARTTRRRLRRLTVRTLIGLFGVAFLIFSALDIYVKFSTHGRLAISSLSALLLLAVFGLFVALRVRARREARRIAVDVESRFRQLETVVSTSVEYGTDAQKTRELSSEAIVAKLIEEAANRSAKVDFTAAVDRRIPRAAFVGAGVVVIVCLGYYALSPRIFSLTLKRFVKPWAELPVPTLTVVDVTPKSREVRKLTTVEIKAQMQGRIPSGAKISYAVVPEGQEADKDLRLKWVEEAMQKDGPRDYTFTFPRMLDSIRYHVAAGDCRTEDYLLTIYEVPKITQLKMKLKYPDYTKMKPKSVDDAIGPITAIKGTEVDLTGIVNKKIAEAKVEFQNPKQPQVPAYKVEGREFHVMFKVMENDKYRLTVEDERGRTNEESIFYTIKALEDRFPTVKIAKPGKNTTVTKTTEVAIAVDADDDFGVTEVGIAFKMKTDEEKRVAIRKTDEPTTSVRSDYTFYLEELKLADTDVVSYYAYARDNDTVSGPKESVSDLFFIEIEPYGQQYRYADSADMEEQGKKGEKGFINNLENLIKRQQKALSDTFNLNRTPRDKWQAEQEVQAKNLVSEENDLQKNATALAEELMARLKDAGLEEHVDRAENISKASDQMGLASVVLERMTADSALPYENQALYYLYRAKRDILNMISMAQKSGDKEMEKKLRQALDLADRDQKTREQEERERQIAELQKKKREMENLLNQQEEVNKKATEQAAKEVKQGEVSEQQKREMEKLAEQQGAMQEKAKEMSQELRNMDYDNPNQSYSAARDANQAAMEMGEAKKSLEQQKPADARDHGAKAEKSLKDALKDVNRALEKSVTDQLKSAAEQARELAEREKQVGQQIGDLEKQLAEGKKPQEGTQSAPQQKDGQKKQDGQPKAGQEQAGQQQKDQEKAGQQQPGPQKGAQQTGQMQEAEGQKKPGRQQPGQKQEGQQAGQQEGQQEGQQQAGQKEGQQAGQGEKGESQAKGEKTGDQKGEQLAKIPGQSNEGESGSKNKGGPQPSKQQGEKQDGQQEGKTSAGPGPTGPFDKYPGQSGNGRSPAQEAQQQQEDLAKEQKGIREDLENLGRRLGDMVPKIQAVDPEVGENVAKVAEQIQKGDTQRQMTKAEDQMKRGDMANAKKDAQGAEKKLDKMANDLGDMAEQFAMDDARRLGKAIAKAKELGDRQEKLNNEMAKLGESKDKPDQPAEAKPAAPQKPNADEVRKEQGKIKEETENLAKQAERIKSIEKSGLSKSVKQSLDTAKEEMEKAETLVPIDPKAAREGGKEAESELRQTAKAMRRMLNETLNEQLSKAAQLAKQMAERQKDSKQTIEKATQDKKDGQPIEQRSADQAAQDQRDAQKDLDELRDRMKTLSAHARAAGEPEVADSVKKADDELKESQTDSKMAQALNQIQGKRWSQAKGSQAEASRSADSTEQRLAQLYEDRTSLPLQRMKAAVEETKDLKQKVDDMKSQVQQQADAKGGKPGKEGKGEAREKAEKLVEDQKDLDKKASALMDRLTRIDPNVQQDLADKVKMKMREVTGKVAKGHLKDAEPGLSETSQSLQKIGEGLIERLNRLVDKSRRRDPDEENAPVEYKTLVEQYFKALSEK